MLFLFDLILGLAAAIAFNYISIAVIMLVYALVEGASLYLGYQTVLDKGTDSKVINVYLEQKNIKEKFFKTILVYAFVVNCVKFFLTLAITVFLCDKFFVMQWNMLATVYVAVYVFFRIVKAVLNHRKRAKHKWGSFPERYKEMITVKKSNFFFSLMRLFKII